MRLLIIEKDDKWSNYVKNFIESKGHKIEIVREPAKAKNLRKCSTFDLILCNFDALKGNFQLISDLINQGIGSKVIIVSSMPNYRDAMLARRYGAVDYIDKTYDLEELLGIICEYNELLKNPGENIIKMLDDPIVKCQ